MMMYSIRITSFLRKTNTQEERTLTAYRFGNAIGDSRHVSIIY